MEPHPDVENLADALHTKEMQTTRDRFPPIMISASCASLSSLTFWEVGLGMCTWPPEGKEGENYVTAATMPRRSLPRSIVDALGLEIRNVTPRRARPVVGEESL